MRRPRAARRARVLAVPFALLAVMAAALAPTAVQAANQVDFGPISATSVFEQGIDVTEKVMAPDAVHRIEVLITTGTSDVASVADVQPSRQAGWTVLGYHLRIPAGSLIPNTAVHLRFRVTLPDGSQETGPAADVRYLDTRFAWKTFEGQIVRVHWARGDADFGRRAAAFGDQAITAASALLGVTETDPIDFYIYPDEASFRGVLGPALRENVGGVAFPEIRTLLAQIAPDSLNDPWVGIVVPHELTHLVFGTATANAFHEPPHWLNEGLAVYLSQGYDAGDRASVEDAAANRTLMPLPSLDGQFPTAGDRFGLAYAEGVSAIDFMVATYGKPALVQLIRSYADGRTDDEAFSAALGVDTAGFEAAWVKSVGAAEPVAAGPQPAPTGALPPGWLAGTGASETTQPDSSAAPPPAGAGAGGSDLAPAAVVGLIAVVVIAGFVVAARRTRSAQPPPPAAPS